MTIEQIGPGSETGKIEIDYSHQSKITHPHIINIILILGSRFFWKAFPNMGGWGHSFPNKNHKFWTNENSPFVFPNLTKTLFLRLP